MNEAADVIVGIDVAKAALDVAVRPSGEARHLANAAAGIGELVGWMQALSPEVIVVEATGGYEAPLVAELLNPYADPGAAAISYYRRAFGDPSLDTAIRAQIAAMPPERPGSLALIAPEVRERRWPALTHPNMEMIPLIGKQSLHLLSTRSRKILSHGRGPTPLSRYRPLARVCSPINGVSTELTLSTPPSRR